MSSYHRGIFPDIKNVPEIDRYYDANGENSEDAVDFRTPGASHENSGGYQPCPPFAGKGATGEIQLPNHMLRPTLTDSGFCRNGYKRRW